MLFQFCSQIFYGIEVSALWRPLQYVDFVVLKPFCHNFGSMSLGHCPFGRPICDQALTSWLMCWDVASIIHILLLPHDAIYFVKCTSPSCSKAPPQHDTATPLLQVWDGVFRLSSLARFPPNITMVIMAKQFYFCFIRLEDISPKSTIFVLMCSCKP